MSRIYFNIFILFLYFLYFVLGFPNDLLPFFFFKDDRYLEKIFGILLE